MAVTKDDLEAFIKSTLLYSERNFEIKYFAEVSPLVSGRKTRSGKLIKHTPADDEADPIGNCMHFLEEYEFIRLQFNEETQEMNYIATRLGHACLGNNVLLDLFLIQLSNSKSYWRSSFIDAAQRRVSTFFRAPKGPSMFCHGV